MCERCERMWDKHVSDKFLKEEQWKMENSRIDKKIAKLAQQPVSPTGGQVASDYLNKFRENVSVARGGHPKFYKILDEMAILHDKKNTDYSKGLPQGPLGNFIRVSEIKKLYPGFDWDSPFGTCIDYMLKQFDAMMILRATKNKSQTGEPIAARLRDVEIYAVIAEIIESEENNAVSKG